MLVVVGPLLAVRLLMVPLEHLEDFSVPADLKTAAKVWG